MVTTSSRHSDLDCDEVLAIAGRRWEMLSAADRNEMDERGLDMCEFLLISSLMISSSPEKISDGERALVKRMRDEKASSS